MSFQVKKITIFISCSRPDQIFLLRRIAYCEIEEGEYILATRDLEVALAVEPDSPKSLFLLFLCRTREGRLGEAQKVLDQLCKSPGFDKEMILMTAKHIFQVFDWIYIFLYLRNERKQTLLTTDRRPRVDKQGTSAVFTPCQVRLDAVFGCFALSHSAQPARHLNQVFFFFILLFFC